MPQATGYPSQTGETAAPVTSTVSTSKLSGLSTQSKSSLLNLISQRLVDLTSYLESLIIKQTHLDMVINILLPKLASISDTLNKQKQTVSSTASATARQRPNGSCPRGACFPSRETPPTKALLNCAKPWRSRPRTASSSRPIPPI